MNDLIHPLAHPSSFFIPMVSNKRYDMLKLRLIKAKRLEKYQV